MGTYLSRTLSSPNVNKFTVSLWVKGINLSGDDYLFALADGGHHVHVRRDGSMKLQNQIYNGGVQIGQLISSALYRDPASWYHVVYRQDIENSTANQRNRLYVNGEEITYGTQTNPSSTNAGAGMSFNIFKTTSYSGTGNNFTGYMTDLNYFDGYSYGPDSFGETDSTTGEWKPKVDFTGVTYGTNGFRCEFGNAAALGTDTSGNNNTLTVNNAGTNAQAVDTASNNFCTLNPLSNNEVPNANTFNYSEGNLNFKGSSGSDTSQMFTVGTIGFSSGKWYWEAKMVSEGSIYPGIGILDSQFNSNVQNGYAHNSSVSAYGYTYTASGTKSNNNSETSYGNSYTTGDIIGIAVDLDNNKIYWSKNGTFQNSGDPTSGSTGTGSAFNLQTGLTYLPTVNLRYSSSAGEWSMNFGNPPFTISSGNADANGFGNFEYAVPSGYYALCTKNINQYG